MNDVQPESAETLFAALNRATSDGRITLIYNYKRLGQMDSPVCSEADGNIWAYGLVAVFAVAWWFAGWQIALGLAAVGVIAYFTIGRVYVHRRIRRRVEEKALSDLVLWRKLWSFGGIGLSPRQGETCTAPQGNWMALVRESA